MLRVSLILTLICLFSISGLAQKEKQVSLIVHYSVNDVDDDLERFVRLDFIEGNLVSKKDLFTIDVDKTGDFFYIVQDRFILITNDDMYEGKKENFKPYDIKTDKFVSKKPFRKHYQNVLKILESQPNGIAYTYFVKSPDGKKSVDYSKLPRTLNPLVINVEGQNDIIINEEFTVTVSSKSSNLPILPLRWIDNETILTQRKNGSLVTVKLDGSVSPFAQIPCSKDDYPYFRTTKADILIYKCSDEFKIDKENRTYEKIKDDLDFGFSSDNSLYYYRDKEIGVEGFRAKTIEGYIATTDGKRDDGFYRTIDKLRIWNQFTKEWQIFTFDGDDVEMFGWYIPH